MSPSSFLMSPTTRGRANLLGKTIDDGRLRLQTVLGVGAYGVVYLAQETSLPNLGPGHKPRSAPKVCAVKCMTKVGLETRQRDFQRREIALHLAAASHPGVVSVHKVLETAETVFVVLEYCPDGDLFTMITEKQAYLGRDELIRRIFLQIVDAVQYLHNKGIYHRDLKPENILCMTGGTSICIADFGLATDDEWSGDHGCGSYFYMVRILSPLASARLTRNSAECQSPECLRKPKRGDVRGYSTPLNDIWSLGIILINLACARNPWKQASPHDSTFRAYARNPDSLSSVLPLSQACHSLLKGMLHIDPSSRLTLNEIHDAVRQMPSFTLTATELMSQNAIRVAQVPQKVPLPALNTKEPSEGKRSSDPSSCIPQSDLIPSFLRFQIVGDVQSAAEPSDDRPAADGQGVGPAHHITPDESDHSDTSRRSSLLITPPASASRASFGDQNIARVPLVGLAALDLDGVIPAPVPKRPWLRVNPLRIFSG